MKSTQGFFTSRRPWIICQTAGSLFLLNGCNFEMYAPEFPHENFVRALNTDVGKKFEDISDKTGSYANSYYLVSKVVMPDGVLTYTYQYSYPSGKNCNFTYEVDASTRIVRAVHVGSACRLSP